MERRKRAGRNARYLYLLSGITLFLLLVVPSWAASRIAAASNYSPQLGEPLFWRVYPPWYWPLWTFQYYSQNPDFFRGVALTTCGILGGWLLFAAALGSYLRSHSTDGSLHGSARWAKDRDVARTGFVQKSRFGSILNKLDGVYLGTFRFKQGDRYLVDDSDNHVLVLAPTRAGKGVGVVTPTMLSWTESCVVTDMKGEIYDLTAGWREKHAGNRVLLFAPFDDKRTVRFNPLDAIRLDTDHDVGDAQNISTMLVDYEGKGMPSYWDKAAHQWLVGALLHHCYESRQFGESGSLTGFAEMLADPKRPIDDLLKAMLGATYCNGSYHPYVAGTARSMSDMAPNQKSGVLETALSFLSVYRDPVVAEALSRSDFSIDELMRGDKPCSLYLNIPVNQQKRAIPLFRLVISQIIDHHCREIGRHSEQLYKHRLLLLMDEFPAFGRLPTLEASLAFMAGFGLKACLIGQDMQQIYSAYGKHETITANCRIQVAFPPDNAETAEFISKRAGVTTVVSKTHSFSGKRNDPLLGKATQSVSHVRRPLITPDEVSTLPRIHKGPDGVEGGKSIVFYGGYHPILVDQILYWDDPIFEARAKLRPPADSAAPSPSKPSSVMTFDEFQKA